MSDLPAEDTTAAPTPWQVKAAAVLVRHATSGWDLDDLAGALGIRHAVEPAARWIASLDAGEQDPSIPVENRATPQVSEASNLTLTSGLRPVFTGDDQPRPAFLERLVEHVAAYAASGPEEVTVTHVPPPELAPAVAHIHDPFTAWREDGIPYATCECGVVWERTTCTYCPAIVSALHVATHGPAHKHCAAKAGASS